MEQRGREPLRPYRHIIWAKLFVILSSHPMQHKTLYDKIWSRHVVVPGNEAPSIIYVDLHLVHEVTSPQAFAMLRERHLGVRRPDRTFATTDHSIPTISR